MRKASIVNVGAIAFGLQLMMISGVYHLGNAIAEQVAANVTVPGYDSPTREKHSTTTSAFDLCMAIGAPYGCQDFRFATTSPDEKDAGSAMVGGRKVRVSTYASGSALLDAISGSGGRDRAKRPLTILVGGNWTLTYPTGGGESPAFAQKLAMRMGGQWLDPRDFGWPTGPGE